MNIFLILITILFVSIDSNINTSISITKKACFDSSYTTLIQAHFIDAIPPNNVYCIGECESGMCCKLFPVPGEN